MSATQANSIPFHEALGERLSELRRKAGARQETVALFARRWGLPWRRSLVAQIETGRRHLTLDEWFLLPKVFSQVTGKPLEWTDLLPHTNELITLASDVYCYVSSLRALIKGKGRIPTDDEAVWDWPHRRRPQQVQKARGIAKRV